MQPLIILFSINLRLITWGWKSLRKVRSCERGAGRRQCRRRAGEISEVGKFRGNCMKRHWTKPYFLRHHKRTNLKMYDVVMSLWYYILEVKSVITTQKGNSPHNQISPGWKENLGESADGRDWGVTGENVLSGDLANDEDWRTYFELLAFVWGVELTWSAGCGRADGRIVDWLLELLSSVCVVLQMELVLLF